MLQVVFVKWGVKYSSAYVNAMVEAIAETCSSDLKFICYTEKPEGLSDQVEARAFPDLGFPLEQLIARRGSLPKFSMFKPGELDPDAETIYLDLDTAIFGDIAPLGECLKRTGGLYFCGRHAVPTWRFRKLFRLVKPDGFYLGNTAVMAFYPRDWTKLYDRFMEEYPQYVADPDKMDPVIRDLYDEGNERIISYNARDVSRTFPRRLVTKFTQEYMSPLLPLAQLKDHLPWVKARRKRQPVITFHGEMLKPEHLAKAKTGDLITHKFHKTRWNYDRIGDFWRAVLARDQA